MEIIINEEKHEVGVERISQNEFLLNIGGKIHNIIVYPTQQNYSISVNGKLFRVEKQSLTKFLEKRKNLLQKRLEVKASMSGKVVRILAKEGEQVKEDQGILVLEAMKMENEIKSPQTGRIIKLAVTEGTSVETGNLLFIVE
jgi:biotin carboxyl carrier protein